MSIDIQAKPKPWTQLLCEMELDTSLIFPVENATSIKSLICGSAKGSPKFVFPDRKFKTKTVMRINADLSEQKVLEVKRVK